MLANNRNYITEMSKYRALERFTSNSKRMRYEEKSPEVAKVFFTIYILILL